jgi:CpeT/CpcT family (DUF1001).
VTDLALRFAKTLSGHYSNASQAHHDPVKFAHINVYFRPLPWEVFQGPGFYSEQSYNHDPWRPYRQGVHRLIPSDQIQVVENYGFDKPIRLAGAGFKPELLKLIHIDRLKQRCGCAMHFHETTQGCFSGAIEPGQNCLVPRNGRLTYLVSEVLVDHEHWISRDQGFDPNTHALQWGSEHGPLRFERVASFENEITAEWMSRSTQQETDSDLMVQPRKHGS